MLESALKEQLKGIFAGLNANYTFDISISPAHESRQELLDLLGDVASCSDKISMRVSDGDGLEFILLKDGAKTGIKFRGVPNGHEFTSLLLAILNSDGKGKNFPDESICNRVKALNGPIHLTTYVSLTCTNYPDVVQALNAMTTLNPQIHHEMVDGAINQAEVDALKIQGVPSVFADGKLIHVGRGEFGELLSKLEAQYGINESLTEKTVKRYDVVVVGGGPAGASSAIYSARKGLSVAVVAERIGGQVKETVGIENLISVPETTGTQLADNLRLHMRQYPIDLLEHRRIEKVTIEGNEKVLSTAGGEIFKAPAVIIATGASWRKLNVPGEAEYIGRGVAFCPHCDGPFYKGKHVAVEVPAAMTVAECWDLVNTAEQTRRHCMMLENCCYDFFEMATLNMAQQGLFGDVMHAEGAYIHDLRSYNYDTTATGYKNMWRLKAQKEEAGNPYPTHGLGPVAQILNIHRGDRMATLVSMSNAQKGMHLYAAEHGITGEDTARIDMGDMNTTLIRTAKGKTIMIQHDLSLIHI